MKTPEDFLERILTIHFHVNEESKIGVIFIVMIDEKEMLQAAEIISQQLPEDITVIFNEKEKRLRMTIVDDETSDIFTSKDNLVYNPFIYEEFKAADTSRGIVLNLAWHTEGINIQTIKQGILRTTLVKKILYTVD